MALWVSAAQRRRSLVTGQAIEVCKDLPALAVLLVLCTGPPVLAYFIYPWLFSVLLISGSSLSFGIALLLASVCVCTILLPFIMRLFLCIRDIHPWSPYCIIPDAVGATVQMPVVSAATAPARHRRRAIYQHFLLFFFDILSVPALVVLCFFFWRLIDAGKLIRTHTAGLLQPYGALQPPVVVVMAPVDGTDSSRVEEMEEAEAKDLHAGRAVGRESVSHAVTLDAKPVHLDVGAHDDQRDDEDRERHLEEEKEFVVAPERALPPVIHKQPSDHSADPGGQQSTAPVFDSMVVVHESAPATTDSSLQPGVNNVPAADPNNRSASSPSAPPLPTMPGSEQPMFTVVRVNIRPAVPSGAGAADDFAAPVKPRTRQLPSTAFCTRFMPHVYILRSLGAAIIDLPFVCFGLIIVGTLWRSVALCHQVWKSDSWEHRRRLTVDHLARFLLMDIWHIILAVLVSATAYRIFTLWPQLYHTGDDVDRRREIIRSELAEFFHDLPYLLLSITVLLPTGYRFILLLYDVTVTCKGAAQRREAAWQEFCLGWLDFAAALSWILLVVTVYRRSALCHALRSSTDPSCFAV